MSLQALWICGVITAIEMVGAVFAKREGLPWFVAGLVSFLALFVAYKHSLTVASLTTITVVWIVLSQISALLVDRFWFKTDINIYQYAGAGIMLVGVLVMCIPLPTPSDLNAKEEKEIQHARSGS